MWIYNHERLDMAIGGITPKIKLAMGIYALLSIPLKKRGITNADVYFFSSDY